MQSLSLSDIFAVADLEGKDSMVKSSFLQNGNFWKFLLWLIGIAATGLIAYGTLTAKVDGLDKGYNELKNRVEQNDSGDNETKRDVRELKTDIKYIRQGVDELRLEMRKVPY